MPAGSCFVEFVQDRVKLAKVCVHRTKAFAKMRQPLTRKARALRGRDQFR